MGYIKVDLHNNGKDMEYYATKLHQLEPYTEVSKVPVMSKICCLVVFGIIKSLCMEIKNMEVYYFCFCSSFKNCFILDKYYMLPRGSIISLCRDISNSGSVIFMILIIIPTLFSLLDKDYIIPFGIVIYVCREFKIAEV